MASHHQTLGASLLLPPLSPPRPHCALGSALAPTLSPAPCGRPCPQNKASLVQAAKAALSEVGQEAWWTQPLTQLTGRLEASDASRERRRLTGMTSAGLPALTPGPASLVWEA